MHRPLGTKLCGILSNQSSGAGVRLLWLGGRLCLDDHHHPSPVTPARPPPRRRLWRPRTFLWRRALTSPPLSPSSWRMRFSLPSKNTAVLSTTTPSSSPSFSVSLSLRPFLLHRPHANPYSRQTCSMALPHPRTRPGSLRNQAQKTARPPAAPRSKSPVVVRLVQGRQAGFPYARRDHY